MPCCQREFLVDEVEANEAAEPQDQGEKSIMIVQVTQASTTTPRT